MEGFITLLFIKVEGQNFADWVILMSTFQKLSSFKIEGFYDVIMTSSLVYIKKALSLRHFRWKKPKIL